MPPRRRGVTRGSRHPADPSRAPGRHRPISPRTDLSALPAALPCLDVPWWSSAPRRHAELQIPAAGGRHHPHGRPPPPSRPAWGMGRDQQTIQGRSGTARSRASPRTDDVTKRLCSVAAFGFCVDVDACAAYLPPPGNSGGQASLTPRARFEQRKHPCQQPHLHARDDEHGTTRYNTRATGGAPEHRADREGMVGGDLSGHASGHRFINGSAEGERTCTPTHWGTSCHH